MKVRYWFRILGPWVCLFALAACARPPEPVPDPAADREAVEQTITKWFDEGIARIDTAAIGRLLTPSFQILEDSVWYDKPGFLAFVQSMPGQIGVPFTLRYSFSDWRTAVRGDVAWTSFRNQAVLTPEGAAPMNLDWWETAVLVRSDGGWLIDRYQSAPVR